MGAREMFRRGADQVKVMANGGCISPADELTSIQFTVADGFDWPRVARPGARSALTSLD